MTKKYGHPETEATADDHLHSTNEVEAIKAPPAYVGCEFGSSEFGPHFILAKLNRPRSCDFGDWDPLAIDDSGGVLLWTLDSEELVALILEWQAEQRRIYLREVKRNFDAKLISFEAIHKAREGKR